VIIETYQPDVIGIQETKVQDADFPIKEIQALGYHAEFFGQKTHYGVALLSRQEPQNLIKGFPGEQNPQAQRRLIGADYSIDGEEISILNGYFPQGESRDHAIKFPAKEKFYSDLNEIVKERLATLIPLVVMGDFNIAPNNKDIGIGADNAKRWLKTGKCSFLPEEREWYEHLCSLGLSDSFRLLHPNIGDQFSWFDYRSRGFEREPKRGLRIDHILISESLNPQLSACSIDYALRSMEKPSDHCPVIAEFNKKNG